MTRNPGAPNLIQTHPVVLSDGRRVRVREYDNHEIRFAVDGTPYVLTECYLSGGSNDHAIIKLSPGKQGNKVPRPEPHPKAIAFAEEAREFGWKTKVEVSEEDASISLAIATDDDGDIVTLCWRNGAYHRESSYYNRSGTNSAPRPRNVSEAKRWMGMTE